jgi:hypothetical protein
MELNQVTLAGVIVAASWSALAAQTLPTPGDSRHGMLREAMLGSLPNQPLVPTLKCGTAACRFPASLRAIRPPAPTAIPC